MKKILFPLLLWVASLGALAAPDPALVRQLAADDNSDKIAASQQLTAAAGHGTAKLLQAQDGRKEPPPAQAGIHRRSEG